MSSIFGYGRNQFYGTDHHNLEFELIKIIFSLYHSIISLILLFYYILCPSTYFQLPRKSTRTSIPLATRYPTASESVTVDLLMWFWIYFGFFQVVFPSQGVIQIGELSEFPSQYGHCREFCGNVCFELFSYFLIYKWVIHFQFSIFCR